MARETLDDLRAQLAQERRDNESLREQLAHLRAVLAVVRNALESAIK